MVPTLPNLRRVREAHFLSQQELAAKSGVSRVTITRAESGLVDVHFATVRKLAAALDVDPSELIATAPASG